MKLVVLGLSITSSWGNGHATTYRGLLREFTRRGHQVTFLEREVPWYATNRDLPNPVFCATRLYHDLGELEREYGPLVAESQAIIDDLTDEEIARFTEFMNRAIELQARHVERVRNLPKRSY